MDAASPKDQQPEAKVLVVDRDPEIVELLSVSLKLEGFEVQTADTGPAAIACAQKTRPDAVILEVRLPAMNGFQVLRRLRSLHIAAPALFIAAHDRLEDKLAGLTIGGDDFISKPFSVEELIARLRAILRRLPAHGREPASSDWLFPTSN